MSKRLIWPLLLVGALVACQKFAEGRQMFRELLALREQIMRAFHERVIDVNITTGHQMTVKFMDSPMSSRSRQEKQDRADEVAAFVATHYKHPVSSVSVEFVSRNGGSKATAAASETYVGRPPRVP